MGCWSVVTLANNFPVSVFLCFQSRPEGSGGLDYVFLPLVEKRTGLRDGDVAFNLNKKAFPSKLSVVKKIFGTTSSNWDLLIPLTFIISFNTWSQLGDKGYLFSSCLLFLKKNLAKLFNVSLVSAGQKGKLILLNMCDVSGIPVPSPGTIFHFVFFPENGGFRCFQLYRSLVSKETEIMNNMELKCLFSFGLSSEELFSLPWGYLEQAGSRGNAQLGVVVEYFPFLVCT